MSTILDIPFELIWEFGLSYIDIISLSMTCKHFRKLANNEDMMYKLMDKCQDDINRKLALECLESMKRYFLRASLNVCTKLSLKKPSRLFVVKGSILYKKLEEAGYRFAYFTIGFYFKVEISSNIASLNNMKSWGLRTILRSKSRKTFKYADCMIPEDPLEDVKDILRIKDEELIFPDIGFVIQKICQTMHLNKIVAACIASSNSIEHDEACTALKSYHRHIDDIISTIGYNDYEIPMPNTTI